MASGTTPSHRSPNDAAFIFQQLLSKAAKLSDGWGPPLTELGVTLTGQANAITDTLRAGADGWVVLADGSAAAECAKTQLVIGGLRGDEQNTQSANGHVVVVVPGGLAQGRYPTAYWGRYKSVGTKNQTVNWAWTKEDRDKVVYAAHAIAT